MHNRFCKLREVSVLRPPGALTNSLYNRFTSGRCDNIRALDLATLLDRVLCENVPTGPASNLKPESALVRAYANY